MTEQKTGIEKAREVVNGFKSEDKERTEREKASMEESIIALKSDPALAAFMNENSKMGSENIQPTIPSLKLHVANKSVGDELANGEEPNDGWFFYPKTKQQFQNPIIHVLSISRKFYTKSLSKKKLKEGKNDFNQLLSGVIVDDGEYLPFIMYFTSNKLRNLWNFAKNIQPYTHNKPVSIPMFALLVKLSCEKIPVEYEDDDGMKKKTTASLVKFDLIKNDKGNPTLSTDLGELTFLRDLLVQSEDAVNILIDSRDVGEFGDKIKTIENGGYGTDTRNIDVIAAEDAPPALEEGEDDHGPMPF